MKAGKLSELILNRSVLKKVKHKHEEVQLGAKSGFDAAVLKAEGCIVTATAVSSSLGFMPDIDKKSEAYFSSVLMNVRATVIRAVNSTAAGFARPFAISVSMILPPDVVEQDIKKIMDVLADTAKELGVEIAGGHSEVSAYVTRPIVSVTAYGELYTKLSQKKAVDIVMTGYMGTEGTAFISCLHENILKERFQLSYIHKAAECANHLSVVLQAQAAAEFGVAAMHDVSTTGIFGALWELGEQLNCGFEIGLKEIPVRQETIEITEHLNINPFIMPSSGALLIAAEDGYELVCEFEKQGIKSAIIGRFIEGNDKIVLNNGEKRFLEQPR